MANISISIIPGATVAVVRIKIKAAVLNENYEISGENSYTKWKLYYKPIDSSDDYISTEELWYNNDKIYGEGPLFYDLTNLEQNTPYCIKLVITGGDVYDINTESDEKVFTTTSLPVNSFKFQNVEYKSDDIKPAADELLGWFEDCMNAVGYDYVKTNDRTDPQYKFPNNIALPTTVDCNPDHLQQGAGGGYNKGDIILRYFQKSTLVHEYRHFLGLSMGDETSKCIQYHGDSDRNFGTWNRTGWNNAYPDAKIYYKNICDVYGFSRGVDPEENMEIYVFYGENSVDSTFINHGYQYLSFMLLKALGLNDINIVY